MPRMRCQPGFYRCSGDSAGILGSGSSRHRFSTHRRYPQCEQGTPRTSCTNRASTGVANDVQKCDQPGFYRCGHGAVLADLCQGGCGDQGYQLLLPLYPRQDFFIRIFTDDANWASTSAARTSEREWEPNSHRFLLRFRIGRDQHTTSDRRRQLEI